MNFFLPPLTFCVLSVQMHTIVVAWLRSYTVCLPGFHPLFSSSPENKSFGGRVSKEPLIFLFQVA